MSTSKKTKDPNKVVDDIASSLAGIVRYSSNEEFRQKCFQLLSVDCTEDLQKISKKKLEEIVGGKWLYTTPASSIDQEKSIIPPTSPVLTLGTLSSQSYGSRFHKTSSSPVLLPSNKRPFEGESFSEAAKKQLTLGQAAKGYLFSSTFPTSQGSSSQTPSQRWFLSPRNQVVRNFDRPASSSQLNSELVSSISSSPSCLVTPRVRSSIYRPASSPQLTFTPNNHLPKANYSKTFHGSALGQSSSQFSPNDWLGSFSLTDENNVLREEDVWSDDSD